jgi:hypothetical protein
MNYLQLKIKKTNSITILLMLKSTFVEIPKPPIKLSIILPKQSTKLIVTILLIWILVFEQLMANTPSF